MMNEAWFGTTCSMPEYSGWWGNTFCLILNSIGWVYWHFYYISLILYSFIFSFFSIILNVHFIYNINLLLNLLRFVWIYVYIIILLLYFFIYVRLLQLLDIFIIIESYNYTKLCVKVVKKCMQKKVIESLRQQRSLKILYQTVFGALVPQTFL